MKKVKVPAKLKKAFQPVPNVDPKKLLTAGNRLEKELKKANARRETRFKSPK